MPTVGHVDLTSFSGDWFVIAHIPASLEKNAFNAVESYRVAEDGTIETTWPYPLGVSSVHWAQVSTHTISSKR